jgi:hypothetical protein
MPDDNGWGSGPRQIAHEKVGGWDDIVVALRDTFVLGVIAALEAAFVLFATLLAGPWSLLALFPLGLERVALWVTDADEQPWPRQALIGWGLVAALLLLIVPDAALVWWPWRWQATRESWWGLLWPARWPRVVPALVLLRGVILAAVVRAWSEVWYLVQRLRREVLVPTASGAAFESANLSAIDVPGAWNPHVAPVIDVTPTPKRESDNRALPFSGSPRLRAVTASPIRAEDGGPAWASGNGNGHADDIGETLTRALYPDRPPALEADDRYIETDPPDAPRVDFPARWFVTPTRAEEWAAWVLADADERFSANKAWRSGFAASHAAGLSLFAWLRERRFARRVSGNGQQLTAAGRWLLSQVAAGRWREWEAEPAPDLVR